MSHRRAKAHVKTEMTILKSIAQHHEINVAIEKNVFK